jgi:hypothetical protein
VQSQVCRVSTLAWRSQQEEGMTLSKEWLRLAGAYERAADAVRKADYDPRVSDADYGARVDARERAFAALRAESEERS